MDAVKEVVRNKEKNVEPFNKIYKKRKKTCQKIMKQII